MGLANEELLIFLLNPFITVYFKEFSSISISMENTIYIVEIPCIYAIEVTSDGMTYTYQVL
jgi:hypothetical protein